MQTSLEITIHPRRITFRHSDGRTGQDGTPSAMDRARVLAYYFETFSADRVYVRVETPVFSD